MKKRIISLLLAAAMTFSLTACGGNSSDDKKEETKTENTDNKETPEVDTIHWARANSGNILVTIAKQQGYFDEVGINVIEDPVESSTAALQALQEKQVDVTSNQGTNNPLQFISTGSDFSIVGGYMLKGMYIIGKKDTQYKDVTSLKQKNTYLNLSLKDYIIGWMIFEGQHFVESEQSHTLKGNYLMALFTDDFSDMAVEAAKLGRIWEHFYLYEEKHSLTVVLYQVSEKNAQKIYQMAQKENLNCYMSETFEDINDCRTKRDLLKQMERIPKICDVRGVKREKDWYLQGIFSYTLPLIEEAGLSDYSILNLIKEDEKNHTELYDTLKMYLLCENNVTMAAEKLHVHRNTLVYRLKQIKDCLELDINNNEISRELLAFMIMYDLSKSSED